MPLEAVLSLDRDDLAQLAELVAEHVRVSTHAGEQSPWLDVEGAAAYLVTSSDGIYAHVKRKSIPHYRRGGRLLFNRGELDEWVRGEAA